jgi:hypothetical protein
MNIASVRLDVDGATLLIHQYKLLRQSKQFRERRALCFKPPPYPNVEYEDRIRMRPSIER